MNLYKNQFSNEHNFNSGITPSKTLIICSTPRCGSHMLGHALYETKQFGFPLEYVNPANLNEWKKIFNVNTLDEVLSALKKTRTSGNGVFSIKLHYQHLKQYGSFEEAHNSFINPYYIILSRRELLKQAISLVIANQTGVWISGQEEISSKATYNAEGIENQLRAVIQDNAAWRYALAVTGSNFIELDFDSVKQNTQQSIEKIALFMDVDIDKLNTPQKPTTKKQSASINLEWEERFLNEKRKVAPLYHSGSMVNKVLSKIMK